MGFDSFEANLVGSANLFPDASSRSDNESLIVPVTLAATLKSASITFDL